MGNPDTKLYSRSDVSALKATGQVCPTPADAPQLEPDEAFWEKARIVETGRLMSVGDPPMKSWPVQDAKSRFGEMLAACEREGPQVVTEHGVEAAVLVTFGEWRRLNPADPLDLKELLLSDEARSEELVPAERGAARHREPLEF